jgi:hypothetical protein
MKIDRALGAPDNRRASPHISSVLADDLLESVAEVLVAYGAGADQAGRHDSTDVVGYDIGVRRGPAFRLAVLLGGWLAATHAPVNTEVKAHAVEFRFVVGLHVRCRRRTRLEAGHLGEAIAEVLVADSSRGDQAGWRHRADVIGNNMAGGGGEAPAHTRWPPTLGFANAWLSAWAAPAKETMPMMAEAAVTKSVFMVILPYILVGV